MVEWVRVLRGRGLKTAVLSNISRTVGDYLRRTAQVVGAVRPSGFSGELKMAKPDPAIYHVCLEALGVPAAEALFLDDREVNIAAARAVGMHGIVFRSAENFCRTSNPMDSPSLWRKRKPAPGDRRTPGRVTLKRPATKFRPVASNPQPPAHL